MKILHLSSEYPPAKIYGLGRFVHGLARAQAELGHEVHVLTNSCGGEQDDVVLDGVHVHRIAFPNPPRPPDGHSEVFQFNHGLIARLLERRQRLADVEVVASHDWLTALAAREAARLLDVPLVVTFHDEVLGKRFGLLDAEGRVVRDLEALMTHDASRVVANSAYIARQVERHYGLSPERSSTILGGIDPSLLSVAAPGRVEDLRSVLAAPDELLVAYVGRLDPEKGLETLADAVELTTDERGDVRFVLAGSGALAGALGARLGGRVRLLGYVRGEGLAYLYRAADAVVVPSLYEPLGLVAVEAMLGGAVPVVAATGGLPELVRHEEDGLVVPAGSAEALSAALARLAVEPELRRRLATEAARRAREAFTWRDVAAKTVDAYAQAVAEPRPVCEVAPEPTPRPLVSVTLVTHEAPTHAEAALRSLVRRTRYAPLELVVVDNGSSQGAHARLRAAVEECRALGHAVTLLRNEANRLFSAAQNQAIAAATGEYVCLFNDDAEVPPGAEGWLEALVWLLEDRQAGSVTPVTLHRDGRIYCAGARGAGAHRLREQLDRPQLAREPRPTEWNNMAVCLTRRSLFESVGPLREDGELAHYGSDREWCLRVTSELGLEHWVHPVRLYHHEREALRDPEAPLGASRFTRIPASIVVVAYGQLAFTRRAVESVLADTRPPFELVLVDNGSPDETRAYFESVRDALGGPVAVQVITNEENLGYPRAANQGARAARGRHVVLLNNDAYTRPGWLDALLACAESHEDVGIVAPKVLNPDGTVQNAGGILHHPDGTHTIPHADEDRMAPPVQEARELTSAGGPCMLLTRRLLDEVGVFDEDFSPGYFEDSDLCYRAREAGLVLRYEPRAEVHHHAKVTSSAVAREGKLDVWGQFERNKRRFYDRWGRQLEEEHRARSAAASPQRRRILLCFNRSETTTAAYCAAALRQDHEVVTAGRGQDVDLGPDATARELLEAAGGGFDLLLVVEGENYVPHELAEAPCPTAWWAIDNHLHAARDDGWHFAQAPAFDHVFVAQRDYLPAFRHRGVEAHWLPLACDPQVHRPEPTEKDLDVVFVGHVRSFHQRRRRLLDRLARRFALHEVHGAFREDMARLFARSRVVFNCSLAGDLNMRVFEALASGSLLVTDRIENGLSDLFADGEHLVLYEESDLEDVVGRSMDAEGRREWIASRGQSLVLRHHTYRHRMRRLVQRSCETGVRRPEPTR